MQLIRLRNSMFTAIALAAVICAGSCGDDFVSAETPKYEVNEQLLGIFSAPSITTSNPTHASQLHIRPDGTVLWIEDSGCGKNAYRAKSYYEWRPDGFDKIIITSPSGDSVKGAKGGVYVTPGRSCNEIRVAHMRDNGTELYFHWRRRGELCLRPTECDYHGCSGCKIEWCDPENRPEPCE